jgi:uncharacterized membrane protein
MRSKWLIAALVVSLAGNLALAGFVAGRVSAPAPVPAGLDPTLGMFRMLHALPEERRDALRPEVRASFRGLRDELRRMRNAQHGINEALTAEPFDREALAAALTRFRAALLDSQEHNHAALTRIADEMTAGERRLLRDAMTRARPPQHRRPDAAGDPADRSADR